MTEYDGKAARADDTGRALASDCAYLVTGPMPRARWWSLSAVGSGGEAESDAAPRHGIVSRQIVYDADQVFRVALSPETEAGNWIRPPETGELVLLLRLYSPDRALRRNALAADLPSIERQVCR